MTFSLFTRVMLGIFALSVVCSLGALLLGAHDLGASSTWPALVLAGWAFGGHLVTLDDDAPGGWSNHEGSAEYWHASLRQLAIKFFVFLAVVVLYFSHKT